MEKFRLGAKIIFLAFFSLLNIAYAQPPETVVGFLCEYARSLYEDGDLQDAQLEFSKALVIDPYNDMAKRYLEKINMETAGGLRGRISPTMEENLRLMDKARGLEKEVTILFKENDGLSASLLNKDERINALESELTSLKLTSANELNKYKSELNALREALYARDKQVIEKESQLQDKDTQIEQVKSQLKAAEGQLAQAQSEAEEGAGRIKALQSDLDGINGQLNAARDEVGTLKDSLRKGEEIILDKDAQLKITKEQLAQAEQEARKSDNRINALELNTEELRGKLNAAKDELNRAKGKLQENEMLILDKDNRLTALKEELQEAKDRIAGLDNELELRKKVTDSLLSERQELIEGAKKELEQARGAILDKDTRILELEERIKGIERASQAKGKEYAGQLDRLQVNLDSKSKELADIAVSLDSEKEKITGLNSQLESLKEKLNAITDDRDRQLKAKDAALEELKSQLAESRDETSLVKKDRLEKDSQIKELQEKIKEAEGSYEGLKAQLDEANRELGDAQRLTLDKDRQINNLEDTIEVKTRELENLNGVLAAQREQADILISKLQETVASKDKESSAVNVEQDKLAAQIAQNEGQLKEKETSLGHARAELGAAQEALSQAGEKALEKDAGIKKLEDVLGVKNQEIENLGGVLAAQKEQAANLEDKLNSAREDFAKTVLEKDNQLKAKDSAVEEFKTQLEEVKDKLVHSQKDIADRDARLQEFGNRLKDMENLLAAKDQDLSAIKAELQSQKGLLDKLIAERNDELKNKEMALEELQSKLGLAKDELDVVKKVTDQDKVKELQDMESTYASKLAEYQDRMDKLRSMLRLKDKRLGALNKDVGALLSDKGTGESLRDTQIAQLKEAMRKLQAALQSELDNYKAKLELAQRGIVVSVLTDVLFASGSDKVSREGSQILTKISGALESAAGENNIVIEGHTDNEPIKRSGWRSNWELSSSRALSVLHHLLQNSNINPAKCSVNGYGQYLPLADNATSAGRKQNRRVEIILQPPKIIKAKYEGIKQE